MGNPSYIYWIGAKRLRDLRDGLRSEPRNNRCFNDTGQKRFAYGANAHLSDDEAVAKIVVG